MQPSIATYRLYFAPRAVLQRIMRWWPSTRKPIERCKECIRTFLLPKGPVWVRVKNGLSAQLSMRLWFPEEAGMWLGEHEPEVQSRSYLPFNRVGWYLTLAPTVEPLLLGPRDSLVLPVVSWLSTEILSM
jgi:hypothetical protein